jgi:hypothetical protein
MPAKCVSSVSPRFHYRRVAFCFLPLAAILESSLCTLLKIYFFNPSRILSSFFFHFGIIFFIGIKYYFAKSFLIPKYFMFSLAFPPKYIYISSYFSLLLAGYLLSFSFQFSFWNNFHRIFEFRPNCSFSL